MFQIITKLSNQTNGIRIELGMSEKDVTQS